MMMLPAYEPPSDRRASVAVGLAPIFVVVVFTLIVSGMIAFDTGVAIFLGCTAWVVHEMFDYQRAFDAYQQQCVQDDPAWRGIDALAHSTGADGSDFVRSLADAGRGLLPEHSRL